MFNIKNLTFMLNSLLAEKEQLAAVLSTPKSGRLFGRKQKNGTYQIYIRPNATPKKEKYVNKELLPQAKSIAQYEVAEKLIKDINKKIKALKLFIDAFGNTSSTDIFLQSHPWLKTLLPESKKNDEKLYEWKNMPYNRNMNHPENLRNSTIVPGLMVRSKSEADIISRLEYYGIPYHYDEIIYLNGVRINMDIICHNISTGKKWYWDHRGMLDKQEYIEKTLFCEKQFLNAGIIQGINLIVTSETSTQPLDILEVDNLIKHYLL